MGDFTKFIKQTIRHDPIVKALFPKPPDPPKAPALPPVEEPLTPPEVSVGTGARDELRRRAKARVSGRRKTIVTGDLTPPSAKKSVLG